MNPGMLTSTDPLAPWMGQGACTTPDAVGLPWTTDTHRVPGVLVDLMRETCARCPVLSDCAAYAAETRVTGGFWAGLDRGRTQPGEPAPVPVPVPRTVQLLLPLDLTPAPERTDNDRQKTAVSGAA